MINKSLANVPKYTAREPDAHGYIHFPPNEHITWQTLYQRQQRLLPGRACEEYLEGIRLLGLPQDRIPELPSVDAMLQRTTGWKTAAVPALISFDFFLRLLSLKQFPVATFIRRPEDLEYLQEPDIFHEIYGHCPLLTHQAFAHFTQQYGQLGEKASQEDREFLSRLYWFTVEFGLVNTAQGVRIYGGGILSSPGETRYALTNPKVQRRPFDIIDVLRTPYRIDVMQPIYYVLDNLQQLFDIAETDIMAKIKQAKRLGLFEPTFPPKKLACV